MLVWFKWGSSPYDLICQAVTMEKKNQLRVFGNLTIQNIFRRQVKRVAISFDFGAIHLVAASWTLIAKNGGKIVGKGVAPQC